MFPLHKLFDLRMCGAITQGAGLNTKVLSDNILAAVQGDLDSHNVGSGTCGQEPGPLG